MTIRDDYNRLGIASPKKLLDREIQLYEAKSKDIDILIASNEALINSINIERSKNLMDLRYLILVGSMAFAITCSVFTIVYKMQRDSEIHDLQTAVVKLQQSNLARENTALRKQLDSQKCFFNVCLK